MEYIKDDVNGGCWCSSGPVVLAPAALGSDRWCRYSVDSVDSVDMV